MHICTCVEGNSVDKEIAGENGFDGMWMALCPLLNNSSEMNLEKLECNWTS